MNFEPNLDHLISRYLSGRASEREKFEFEEWKNSCEENSEIFLSLKLVWNMNSFDEYHTKMDAIRDKIWADATESGDSKK